MFILGGWSDFLSSAGWPPAGSACATASGFCRSLTVTTAPTRHRNEHETTRPALVSRVILPLLSFRWAWTVRLPAGRAGGRHPGRAGASGNYSRREGAAPDKNETGCSAR